MLPHNLWKLFLQEAVVQQLVFSDNRCQRSLTSVSQTDVEAPGLGFCHAEMKVKKIQRIIKQSLLSYR